MWGVKFYRKGVLTTYNHPNKTLKTGNDLYAITDGTLARKTKRIVVALTWFRSHFYVVDLELGKKIYLPVSALCQIPSTSIQVYLSEPSFL